MAMSRSFSCVSSSGWSPGSKRSRQPRLDLVRREWRTLVAVEQQTGRQLGSRELRDDGAHRARGLSDGRSRTRCRARRRAAAPGRRRAAEAAPAAPGHRARAPRTTARSARASTAARSDGWTSPTRPSDHPLAGGQVHHDASLSGPDGRRRGRAGTRLVAQLRAWPRRADELLHDALGVRDIPGTAAGRPSSAAGPIPRAAGADHGVSRVGCRRAARGWAPCSKMATSIRRWRSLSTSTRSSPGSSERRSSEWSSVTGLMARMVCGSSAAMPSRAWSSGPMRPWVTTSVRPRPASRSRTWSMSRRGSGRYAGIALVGQEAGQGLVSPDASHLLRDVRLDGKVAAMTRDDGHERLRRVRAQGHLSAGQGDGHDVRGRGGLRGHLHPGEQCRLLRRADVEAEQPRDPRRAGRAAALGPAPPGRSR